MARIRRKDSSLSEAIEILDVYYERAGHDTLKAFASLGKFELEFISSEIEKCLDFRYYAENYHCIKTESEGIRTLYPFWDSQEIFYDMVLTIRSKGGRIKLICLKARQLGMSTVSEALIFHKTFTTEACNALVVAQDPKQTDYLFNMSRLAYDYLPWWMRPEARYEAKGLYLEFDRKDPDERMMHPGLRSAIYCENANKMTGVAVGKTIRAAHLSEISDWYNPQVLSTQIFPTMNAPDTLAIMESTARGRRNLWHKFWLHAIEGRSDWQPVFIESYRVKKYSLSIPKSEEFALTKEEQVIHDKVLVEKNVDIPLEHFYWRRKKIEEFVAIHGEEWKFFQEYPSVHWSEAFQGSGVCAFDKRKLHKIRELTCNKPLWYGEIGLEGKEVENMKPHVRLTETKKLLHGEEVPLAEEYGSRFYVWEQPEEGEIYYIGVDIGMGAKGGDFTTAHVIRLGKSKEPDAQVAEWHGWINPNPFAEVLYAIGTWYNKAEIAVECNGPGLATNNHLYQVLQYDRIFRWKHYDKIKNRITDWFGWWTNIKTRDLIITKFSQAIDEGLLVLRSYELIEECFDFASDDMGEGRYEAQEGNDDRVFAAMIAFFCAHDSDYAKIAASMDRKEERQKKGQDYFNTDYSPVFDSKNTMRRRLFMDKGIPAEGLILGDGYTNEQEVPSEDQWRLW